MKTIQPWPPTAIRHGLHTSTPSALTVARPAIDDPEAAELRALANMHRTVRFSEIACELEERQRDAMRRQLEAWEKYEAAVRAKITLEGRLTMHFLLMVSVVGWVATTLIELARLLL